MRCAVSFLTVLILSTAVGVMALLIILLTEKEDYCGSSVNEFRCTINKQCLKTSDTCNLQKDCPDGSDEWLIYCRDLGTLDEIMGHMLWRPNATASNKTDNDWLISTKPEMCEYHRPDNNKTAPPKGFKCQGVELNETFDTIPWDEIDVSTVIIVMDNGAIHTTNLTGAENETLTIDLTVAENETEKMNFIKLDKVYIEHNYIESVSANAFCNLRHAFWLMLTDNSISNLSSDWFCPNSRLTTLFLSKNNLNLKNFHFKNLPILGLIDLDRNEIEEITDLTFRELPNLKFLNLSHNKIHSIQENAFLKNENLKELDLSSNRLHKLSENLLAVHGQLKKLYITDNPDVKLPYLLFENLSNLTSLNIDTLDISQFDFKSFDFTPYLDMVFFKRFSYCLFVPKARRCYPYSDGVSSNSNLLVGQSRITVWLVGLVTILGNLTVLANRWILQKRTASRAKITKILHIFVTNLAVADLLMGIYLIVLAFKDSEFIGIYRSKAYEWGTSVLCTCIGILALISSEVSLLILTIMSIERYLTIGGPFSQGQHLNVKLAQASMVIIWIFAGILALAPAIQWPSTENTGFYGSTGLCFPIHLDERFPVGWQYTTFVFIGLNSFCLVLITVSYSLLLYTVKTTERRTAAMAKNIELASRMCLLVFTDVLCWAPIIALKASVLFGYELTEDVIVCAVIYLLPLNSAVNPTLYTFSTKAFRQAMKKNVTRILANLELSWMVPPAQNHGGNSVEMHGRTRSIFAGTLSGVLRKDHEQPNTNTAATEDDTELTHSACPTVSAPEDAIQTSSASIWPMRKSE